MTYQQSIKYLESFINYERIPLYPYKESLKLERVKEFLVTIGNPQNCLKCIHIAGSKGKGSTCAFIAYILREAGFKVGLYTSPHLSDFRERIRILNPKSQIQNPKSQFEGMISYRELSGLTQRLRAQIEKYNALSKYGPLSFFEVYTALAFVYFMEKKVDFAVLETGLGGRLDATNIVNALVSVITPISYEHTQKLGNTLTEIAIEKAGIIKSKLPTPNSQLRTPIVISAPQEEEARVVIRNRCKEMGAKLKEVVRPIKKVRLGLIGEHQRMNAAVATAAVKALGLGITDITIAKGLEKTLWPGRCEVVARNPFVILDGAQNTASCRVLKETIKKDFKYRKLTLVLGVSSDKDIKGVCDELSSLADQIILTRADNPRASYPQDLARYFDGKKIFVTQNTGEARRLALSRAQKRDLILVTGSLFVVGEFKDAKA